MTPDNELLSRYAKTGSEDAFAELVRRHVDLVFSAASRQVGGDAHLAQDVAQTVFTDLARKARSLSCRQTLSGWLYTSAHFAAAKIARTEHRRRDREEKFMCEPIHENPPEADWEKLRPVLDEAMHELKEPDREAILLRFFENQPFAQVGAKLNLNENAARMRVERAVEKLRALLAKRGVTTSVAFTAAISANAVQASPLGLASALTSASLATAGTGSSLLTIMLTTKLKLGIGALIAVGAATALVIHHNSQKPSKSKTTSDAALQKMDEAKQGMLAVLMFTKDNQDLYPTNLAEASRYLNSGYMNRIASTFDLLAPASITNITKYASTIVLREKQAWQTPNGKWAKAYGFADGHSEVHVEPTDNFDDFEKDRIVSAPSAQ